MKWLFRLEQDYKCDLSLYLDEEELRAVKDEINGDINFSDKNTDGSCQNRLRITSQGEIIVFEGYSWDGNSPKINFFDLFWLGIPDGILCENKPITYYASLIHDILGQFKKRPNMPSIFRSDGSLDLWFSRGRKGRDGLYFNMLKSNDFILRHLYYLAVALAGPIYDLYLKTFKRVKF